MINRRTIDMWVGVFVMIGLGALLFLALKVANLSSFSAAESYQVKAKFDNIMRLIVSYDTYLKSHYYLIIHQNCF